MKKLEQTVPNLRFKGFTDDWEQRKLGELGSVQMNKRIFKNQTSESGDVPFYKIGTFGKKADAYISNSLYQDYKEKYPYPNKGDLLISASGSIGRIVEYKGQKAYYQDSNIVWLEHNNHVLNSFLKAFYQIVKWDGTEGSTIKRLYNKNILNTKIKLPKVKEQKVLGTLISTVDLLISLQQRKLELLKEIKKGFLQKMFADQDRKQPVLRFKGFHDDWEQRKLGETVFVNSGKDYKGLQKGNIPVYGTGGYMLSVNKYLSNKDAIGIGRKGTINNPYILKAPFWTVDTLFYAIPQNQSDIEFMNAIFQNVNWHKYDESTGVPSLSKSTINQVKVYTTSLREQAAIGSLLHKIEKTISLQHQKLAKYQSIKKSLLQQMFI